MTTLYLAEGLRFCLGICISVGKRLKCHLPIWGPRFKTIHTATMSLSMTPTPQTAPRALVQPPALVFVRCDGSNAEVRLCVHDKKRQLFVLISAFHNGGKHPFLFILTTYGIWYYCLSSLIVLNYLLFIWHSFILRMCLWGFVKQLNRCLPLLRLGACPDPFNYDLVFILLINHSR